MLWVKPPPAGLSAGRRFYRFSGLLVLSAAACEPCTGCHDGGTDCGQDADTHATGHRQLRGVLLLVVDLERSCLDGSSRNDLVAFLLLLSFNLEFVPCRWALRGRVSCGSFDLLQTEGLVDKLVIVLDIGSVQTFDLQLSFSVGLEFLLLEDLDIILVTADFIVGAVDLKLCPPRVPCPSRLRPSSRR